MSGKRLSGDQRELMLGLMRDGLPSQEIADAVGVSTSMVHYYAVRHGIDRSRKVAAKPVEPAEAVAVPPQLTRPRPSLDWQADALCTQTDPEVFFPEKGGSTKEAKRICRRCPVAAECLDEALANDERFGIWGGHLRAEPARPRTRNQPALKQEIHAMSTKEATTETTLTVVKHLINGRDDTFIATATGLAVTTVQDIKVSHGYPDLGKMEWSRDMLEKRINEPAAAAATPSPTIRAAAAPTRPQRPAQPAARPADRRPAVVAAREAKPSANELIAAAAKSPKARTRTLGVKVAGLLGDLSQRLEAEEREQAAQAAGKAANAKRLKRIEELEAELKTLRAKTRSTKTAPPLGAPAPQVRKCAGEQGIQCPAHGKIPNTVRDAYEAAHAAA